LAASSEDSLRIDTGTVTPPGDDFADLGHRTRH
jgi:hypothetical protein